MEAPSVSELLTAEELLEALDEAWEDSLPDDPILRHEEGGWLYLDTTSGAIAVRRAPAGSQASLDLSSPPTIPNAVVIATFHTHPNPGVEGWNTGPSSDDTASAWYLGVPCFIRADDGIHTTGPTRRRGGLAGGPGYPPRIIY